MVTALLSFSLQDGSMTNYRFEEPFANYEILDLTQPDHVDRLSSILVADPLHLAGPAAHSILDIVIKSIHAGQCRSALVEHNYFDQEWSRAYQKFYSRSFPQYNRYSIRIHFFSRFVQRRNLHFLEGPIWSKSYLGYCVVRPLHGRKIGRTVISPSVADSAADFPLTLSTFEVNLAGSRLYVGGAPFLEQDGGAAVCASCAIWMSTAMAGQRFGLPTSTPAEITELATGFPLSERVLGSTGLRVEEMESALRGMGYNPVLLGITNRTTALQAIHPYLEGGLAPILLLQLETGGHAAVAVGHGYDTSRPLEAQAEVMWEEGPIRFRRSSDWINYLLIHDDQRGAFRRLRFLTAGEAETHGLDTQNGCPVEIDMNYSSIAGNGAWPTAGRGTLTGAVIPVPPRISMKGLEAEEKSARLTQILFDTFGATVPENLVLRTYLARSNEFKRRARQRGLPNRIQALYRSKSFPRWIWVTELCSTSDVSDSDPNRRKIRGEIILDGNGSSSTPDFVSIHLVLGDIGYLSMMRPDDHNVADALEHGMLYPGASLYDSW